MVRFSVRVSLCMAVAQVQMMDQTPAVQACIHNRKPLWAFAVGVLSLFASHTLGRRCKLSRSPSVPRQLKACGFWHSVKPRGLHEWLCFVVEGMRAARGGPPWQHIAAWVMQHAVDLRAGALWLCALQQPFVAAFQGRCANACLMCPPSFCKTPVGKAAPTVALPSKAANKSPAAVALS
jgi:hypothetical protein